eukprot:TRINITY_DN56553_c0_g1_i1.p1 TRINITY_DN56553_c0_g1~~TRINITY_DN56553_c0_g1_i1.p1  ORF type:complete len:308 (+),score=60.69 TRINITY_DN56553_c0_g1_i1:94-1017(+)
MALIRERVGRWETMLGDCLQFDQWGQVVEAQDKYRKWLEDVAGCLREDSSGMMPEQRRQVKRLLTSLQLRLENIRHHSQGGLSARPSLSGDGPGIDCATLARIRDRFRAYFFEGEAWPIPIDAHALESGSEDGGEEDEDAFHDNKGTLLGPPRDRGRYLKITVDSIGLKDALTYLDPFITVSVRSGPGEPGLLEREQHTPQPTAKRDERRIPFGVSLFIQTSIGDLVRQRGNIFFEFKHFKPKKSKVSVRCWSMIGWDEIDEGGKCEGTKDLEIYAKPADYCAKKFQKHSVKPLFLTVTLAVIENHG